MDKKILVFYIGVGNIRTTDIPEYISSISKRITPQTFEGEIIIIPTSSIDSRVECINPQYVTEIELINKNNELVAELNRKLNEQFEILNNNDDEKN